MREIECDLVGVVSGRCIVAVPGLNGTELQDMNLQGRRMELLQAAQPTFAGGRRAGDMVNRAAKRLACGQAAFAS